MAQVIHPAREKRMLLPSSPRPEEPSAEEIEQQNANFLANQEGRPPPLGTLPPPRRKKTRRALRRNKTSTLMQPPPAEEKPGYAEAFYAECFRRMVTPDFAFEALVPSGFSVRLRFLEYDVELVGPYPSKQDAKEAASMRGLDLLGQHLVKPEEVEENYNGVLNEYLQAFDLPMPTYQCFPHNFALGKHWACEVQVKLPDRPGLVFGDRSRSFPSKKVARANAAREAVLWLRKEHPQGVTAGSPSRKRRKLSNPLHPGAAPQAVALPVTGPSAAASSSPDVIVGGPRQIVGLPAAEQGPSIPQQVVDLSHTLGLPPPKYDISPDAGTADHWSGAAYIEDLYVHSGPIGTVQSVHGRKNAKDECARGVLQYLKKIEDKRREQAVKTMMQSLDRARVVSQPKKGPRAPKWFTKYVAAEEGVYHGLPDPVYLDYDG